MPGAPLSAILQPLGISTGVLLPVAAMLLFVLLLIPCLMQGTSAEEGLKGMFCIVAQSVGIVLMAVGGLPIVQSVLAGSLHSTMNYAALLFIFAFGGLTYLWYDDLICSLSGSARAIPAAILFYTWKFVGLVLVLLASLSLVLRLLLGDALQTGWWAGHVTMLLFGMILLWCTPDDMKGRKKK